MLKARDLRRKIDGELRGRSPAEQARILEGYVQGWPSNLRGEYVEMRRHLVRRLNRLRNISRATASTAPPEDPFVVPKAGSLTAMLVGLPNAGKSHVFHRLGGDGASVADYPFSTTTPAVHLAPMDNLTIQVVDLPPLVEDAVESLSYAGKLRQLLGLADVLCVVVDASDDVDLQELILSEELGRLGAGPEGAATLVLVNRADEDTDDRAPESPFAGTRVPLRSEADFDGVPTAIAAAAGYLSALAKPPGQPTEEADRLWVRRGATVRNLAECVHRELARGLVGARVWGDSARQPGQRVSAEHRLADGDVVELLAR